MVKKLEISTSGKYVPTIRKTTKWFRLLNSLIFNDILPEFYQIKIIPLIGIWANCLGFEDLKGARWCDLHLEKKFSNEMDFVTILVHEMIHNYDWNILRRDMNHGFYFFSWKRKLESFGIPLHKKYR